MARYNEPTLGDDILDSRDIKRHLEELETQWEDKVNEAMEGARGEAGDDFDEDAFKKKFEDQCEEDGDTDLEDLKKWRKVAGELEGSRNYDHGMFLIHEDHFRQYAEQLADDLGYIKSDVSWPYNHIDWEAAANELRHDYTVYELDGYTYLTND